MNQQDGEEIYTINLNGLSVTIGIAAQILTALETHGSIRVENAALPCNGPGIAAMMLGSCLKPEVFGFVSEGKENA